MIAKLLTIVLPILFSQTGLVSNIDLLLWNNAKMFYEEINRNNSNFKDNIGEKNLHYIYMQDSCMFEIKNQIYSESQLNIFLQTFTSLRNKQIFIIRYNSWNIGATPKTLRILFSLFTKYNQFIVYEETPALMPPDRVLEESIFLQIYSNDKFVKVRRANDLAGLKKTMSELDLSKMNNLQFVLHLSIGFSEKEAMDIMSYLKYLRPSVKELILFPTTSM